MNYFDRNRILTIVLVALMVVNVAALVTIATKGRFFKSKDDFRSRKEYVDSRSGKKDRGKRSSREDRDRNVRGKFSDRIKKQLDLTDEQQAAMDTLWEKNRVVMEELKQRMDLARDSLNIQLGKKELDEDMIQALNDEITEIDREIRRSLLDFNLEIRDLLSEDQLGKYLEMHQRMRKWKGTSKRNQRINYIMSFY